MATFFAKIQKDSLTHKHWRGLSKLGSSIQGVWFNWVAVAGEYVSNQLHEDQVAALRGRPDVVLEMVAVPVPASGRRRRHRSPAR